MLVNRKAQGVTDMHLGELRRIVGERVYVTQTIAEGTAAIRQIVGAGIEVIAIAGDDGTFAQVAADVVAIAKPEQMPVLVPLRLGTGNAIADVTGSSKPTHDFAARAIAIELHEPARYRVGAIFTSRRRVSSRGTVNRSRPRLSDQ